MGRLTGGGNRLELFALSGNAFGASQLVLTRIKNTDITFNDDGSISITPTQEEDSQALYDFIEDFKSAGAVEAVEDEPYEDGTPDGGGSSGGANQDPLGFILMGPRDSTNRKTLRGVCYLQPGAGSWKQENGASTAPSITFKSYAPDADITVAVAKWNTAKVAAPGADKEIPEGSYGVVEFMAKGSE